MVAFAEINKNKNEWYDGQGESKNVQLGLEYKNTSSKQHLKNEWKEINESGLVWSNNEGKPLNRADNQMFSVI